ncbi:MAG: hypothetical protein RIC55_18245 [Pirellulaceae bacterium]
MDLELTLLAIPALALVVLGTLLATASRRARSVYAGVLGLAGVIFGGPGAMFVLTASAADRPATVTGETVESATESAAADADADAADATTNEKTDGDGEAELNGDDAAKRSGNLDEWVKGASSSFLDSAASGATPPSSAPLNEPIMRDSVTIQGEAPDWVKLERVRGSNLDRSVVSTDPFSTVQGCSDALDEALLKETRDYIDWLVEQRGASEQLDFDLDYVNQHLVKERFHQELDVYLVGRMQRKYALLEFDQDFRDAVTRQWDDVRASSRLLLAGLLGGSILGLLGVMFGFFKLDNATRGFYTGRLQFATMAAILGLIAAGVLAARWIPWL